MAKSRRYSKNSKKKRRKTRAGTFMILLILLATFILFAVSLSDKGEKAYPRPKAYIVTNYCREYNVDTNLVYAIMKQESSFEKLAVSPKGATGLMQLMPETAKWSAGKMGIEYNADKLTTASYNLKIAIWYIDYLSNQFENDTTKVIAAYNGGYGNVKKWINNGSWDGTLSDADSIPFIETSNYVKIVSDNLKKYQEIYK